MKLNVVLGVGLVSLLWISTLSKASWKDLSEKRFKVAVIDTGLNIYDPRFRDVLCVSGHKDFTGEGLTDYLGHGTHVAGIIKDAAPDHTKYCLVILKVIRRSRMTQGRQDDALYYVAKNNIKLVNLSLSGSQPSVEEKQALANSGASIVAAAGNNDSYYKNYYPGGYGLPNVYVVGNWDCHKGKMGPDSNYGEGLIWRCGTDIKSTLPDGKTGLLTGTSMATPLYTAELINERH